MMSLHWKTCAICCSIRLPIDILCKQNIFF
jgi:hypothetical protein